MGFPRQGHWSGLPFPPPGDLPDPGIEPESPALQADSLSSEPTGKPEVLREPSNRVYKGLNKKFNARWSLEASILDTIILLAFLLSCALKLAIPGVLLTAGWPGWSSFSLRTTG